MPFIQCWGGEGGGGIIFWWGVQWFYGGSMMGNVGKVRMRTNWNNIFFF